MGIPPSQGKFHPKLPRKMRPRNIFGHFLSKNDQKSLKIWPGWHVQNLGDAFFLEKNRRRQPTPEHMGFLSGKIQDGLHGMASWQRPILAKQALYQNMVLVLIGVYMAPN